MLKIASGQILGPRDDQEDTMRTEVTEELGLFIMADGMGGHENGQEASQRAADAIVACVQNGVKLHDAFEEGNRAVNEIPRHFSEHAPGTTCSALFFELTEEAARRFHYACGMVTLVHAGDSRCYRLRRGFLSPHLKKDGSGQDGEFDVLTRDHTFGRFVGRVLGTEHYIPPDTTFDRVEFEDRYLLCSDGLHGVMKDDEIAAILRATKTPEETVAALLALNGKEPKDNTSVIVIDVVRPPPPPPVENRPRLRFERKQPALIVTFGDTTDPETT